MAKVPALLKIQKQIHQQIKHFPVSQQIPKTQSTHDLELSIKPRVVTTTAGAMN